jgi:hypothetical protein
MDRDRFPTTRYSTYSPETRTAAYMLWELLRLLPDGVELMERFTDALERDRRRLYPS